MITDKTHVMKSTEAINPLSRMLLALAGFALFAVVYLPIWLIELTAPQYPEGLSLIIHSNKLAGQVDIVNGLNHYIGMKTLKAEDFIEFTVLPYIISLFAVAFFVTAFANKVKGLRYLFLSFLLFGLLAMLDFYIWEYNYGHDLNPQAPIKVPGLSYQPPLIGYKKLLNFEIYSYPAIGGWIFIGSGIILAYCLFDNWIRNSSLKRNKK